MKAQQKAPLQWKRNDDQHEAHKQPDDKNGMLMAERFTFFPTPPYSINGDWQHGGKRNQQIKDARGFCNILRIPTGQNGIKECRHILIQNNKDA